MRGGVPYSTSSTCVQGITRPLGGYDANRMIEPSSPASAWQFQSVKHEPMDLEERNDSGINSGSDFNSSSPQSDRSDNIPYSLPSTSQVNDHQASYYSHPLTKLEQQYQHHMPLHMMYSEHNPLTPPNSEPMVSPKCDAENKQKLAERLTPCPSPATDQQPSTSSGPRISDDPLRRLQMSFEQNGFLQAPPSPKTSECSAEDNKSDNEMDDDLDEQSIRTPKVNSHGKIKKYKCKQCKFVAITKLDFWEHLRKHICPTKLLTCPRCPFVTELKHHLEYHLLNHSGIKPFKCNQCKYTCVNKSMLNSHLKSHSNIYQYRCADCSYITKYCHSLKVHLRKYKHEPDTVLNPDGTPNPLPIIDVYGTRRGPKMKIHEQKPAEETPAKPEGVPFPFNQFLLNPPQFPLPFPGFPFFPGFPSALQNPLLLSNLETLARECQKIPAEEQKSEAENEEEEEPASNALDLSKPTDLTPKNRRKGRAFKLTPTRSISTDDDEEGLTTIFSDVEVVDNSQQLEAPTQEPIAGNRDNNSSKEEYRCEYCDIRFGDPVLYTMHMGYHGYQNPFVCNMCGEVCNDKISFYLHIARTSHP